MMAVGDSGSCIQLLAPLNDESTIAKFLDRSGPGIQQLAYRVTDLDAVSATLRERGLRLLYDEPRRGTSDSRVNFVHPKDAGGILVELVEPALTPTDLPSRRYCPAVTTTRRQFQTSSRRYCPAVTTTRRTSGPSQQVESLYYRQVTSAHAADPRRHPRWRHRRRRSSRTSTCRSPTAPRRCTRTRSTCSRGWRRATRTRASRCTSRTSRCPSSARARRWWRSWRARSTTTPCGPRSSSRCRRSGSSSATAASRR